VKLEQIGKPINASFWSQKMYKLLKSLGVLAVVVSCVGQASAFSSSVFPVTLTGGPEEFLLSYSSSSSFSITDLSLELGNPGSPPNLFAVSGTTFFPFTASTSSVGNTIISPLTGSLSEVFSGPAGNYTFSYTTNATNSVSLGVSPVPLPASFPLFAMALMALGMFGYHTARSKFSGLNRQLVSADSAIS
jgi:hypothetical protein